MTFANEADYDKVDQGDELELVGLRKALSDGKPVTVRNLTKGSEFAAEHNLTPRQAEITARRRAAEPREGRSGSGLRTGRRATQGRRGQHRVRQTYV